MRYKLSILNNSNYQTLTVFGVACGANHNFGIRISKQNSNSDSVDIRLNVFVCTSHLL